MLHFQLIYRSYIDLTLIMNLLNKSKCTAINWALDSQSRSIKSIPNNHTRTPLLHVPFRWRIIPFREWLGTMLCQTVNGIDTGLGWNSSMAIRNHHLEQEPLHSLLYKSIIYLHCISLPCLYTKLYPVRKLYCTGMTLQVKTAKAQLNTSSHPCRSITDDQHMANNSEQVLQRKG